MEPQAFLGGRVVLHKGDCSAVIKTLPDNSVDAIITDPPYALESIRKRFGGPNAAPAQHGTDGAFARASRGFMGKEWDTGDVAFDPEFWAECLRVLKPGGHLAAFSGTRTYHRMANAIELAGFEIRDQALDMFASDTYARQFMASLNDEQLAAFVRLVDESSFTGQLAWAYGTGFPKALDVAKAIDQHLGVERTVTGTEELPNDMRNSALLKVGKGGERAPNVRNVTEATSPEAKEWDGWKTALKPAWEPICLARKPLDGTVAENVLEHGTGALNIEACRIPAEKATGWGGAAGGGGTWNESNSGLGKDGEARPVDGRYPANIIHDGSAEVVSAFPDSAGQLRPLTGEEDRKAKVYGKFAGVAAHEPRGDEGSAARFFYSAKADADDRLRTKHPTVKRVDNIQWLCRLLCRKGGTVLDPFAGTGTTGQAAYWEGQNAILIEREEDYQADIAFRMGLVLSGPEERKRARTDAAPAEETPLFAWGVDESQTVAGE